MPFKREGSPSVMDKDYFLTRHRGPVRQVEDLEERGPSPMEVVDNNNDQDDDVVVILVKPVVKATADNAKAVEKVSTVASSKPALENQKLGSQSSYDKPKINDAAAVSPSIKGTNLQSSTESTLTRNPAWLLSPSPRETPVEENNIPSLSRRVSSTISLESAVSEDWGANEYGEDDVFKDDKEKTARMRNKSESVVPGWNSISREYASQVWAEKPSTSAGAEHGNLHLLSDARLELRSGEGSPTSIFHQSNSNEEHLQSPSRRESTKAAVDSDVEPRSKSLETVSDVPLSQCNREREYSRSPRARTSCKTAPHTGEDAREQREENNPSYFRESRRASNANFESEKDSDKSSRCNTVDHEPRVEFSNTRDTEDNRESYRGYAGRETTRRRSFEYRDRSRSADRSDRRRRPSQSSEAYSQRNAEGWEERTFPRRHYERERFETSSYSCANYERRHHYRNSAGVKPYNNLYGAGLRTNYHRNSEVENYHNKNSERYRASAYSRPVHHTMTGETNFRNSSRETTGHHHKQTKPERMGYDRRNSETYCPGMHLAGNSKSYSHTGHSDERSKRDERYFEIKKERRSYHQSDRDDQRRHQDHHYHANCISRYERSNEANNRGSVFDKNHHTGESHRDSFHVEDEQQRSFQRNYMERQRSTGSSTGALPLSVTTNPRFPSSYTQRSTSRDQTNNFIQDHSQCPGGSRQLTPLQPKEEIERILRILSQCPIPGCMRYFETRKKTRDHLTNDHEQKFCDYCWQIFTTRGVVLKEHFLTHADKITEKVSCTVCGDPHSFVGYYKHLSKCHLKPFENQIKSVQDNCNQSITSDAQQKVVKTRQLAKPGPKSKLQKFRSQLNNNPRLQNPLAHSRSGNGNEARRISAGNSTSRNFESDSRPQLSRHNSTNAAGSKPSTSESRHERHNGDNVEENLAHANRNLTSYKIPRKMSI